MRSIYRSLPGVLVAMLAIGAFAATSASAALPEFQEPSLGIHPMTFTGTGGTVTIHEEIGSTYSCTMSSITGEITGAKEVAKVVLTFTDGGGNCSTFCRTSTGKWVTNELKGRIAYISSASRTVGLLLEAATEPMTTCAHLGVTGAKVQKAIIGKLTPVNEQRKTPFHLTYNSSGATQELQHFEGEEVMHNLQILPTGAPSAHKFALTNEMTLTTAREVEIAA